MKALERDLPFAASARAERKDGSGLPDLHHTGDRGVDQLAHAHQELVMRPAVHRALPEVCT